MKWLILAGSVSIFAIADFFAYRWSKTGNHWLLLLTGILGAIGYVGFAIICRHVPMASTPMVGIGVAGCAVLVGHFIFEEGLSWQQMVGLALVVLAFLMLSLHAPKQ